jgi:hypothetical protein
MPKPFFYAGIAAALLLACASAVEAVHEILGSAGGVLPASGMHPLVARSAVALLAGAGLIVAFTISPIFVRMASLLAARNLFGAFLALFSASATAACVAAVLFLHLRAGVAPPASQGGIAEVLAAGWLAAGALGSVSFLTLRPYFRIQASRLLANLVLLPVPLFCILLVQETRSRTLSVNSPGSFVFAALIAVLFTAIALHCVRHRHLFIEVTSIRKLLDPRVDLRSGGGAKPIAVAGDVAFDS